MNFQQWYNQSIGQHIDIDGAYGDQCVDVAMSWAQFCFPDHQWPELLGHGDAKDLFNTASSDFFDKAQAPAQTGDMVVFGSTSTNPYGHIAVVISADSSQMSVIEQNGFNPSGVAYTAQRPYNNVIGFLRPKLTGEDMKVNQDELNKIVYLATGQQASANPGFENEVGNDLDTVLEHAIAWQETKDKQLRADAYDGLQKQVADLTAQLQAVPAPGAVVTPDVPSAPTPPVETPVTPDQTQAANSIIKFIRTLLGIKG